MTRLTRAVTLLPAALLAAALTTGCTHSTTSAGTPPPAPSASELAHMRQLLDGAESAAATAESDAASDK